MEEIGGRISAVIKAVGMTKTAFAVKLNLSQQHVSNICIGRKFPSDRTISDICRIFNVNETWLRHGEGEMFIQSDDSILERLSSEYKLTKREQTIISSFLGLPDTDREVIVRYIEDLAKKFADTGADTGAAAELTLLPPLQPEPAAPDLMSMLAEMKEDLAETRRENAELKKRIANIEEEDAAKRKAILDTALFSSSASRGKVDSKKSDK